MSAPAPRDSPAPSCTFGELWSVEDSLESLRAVTAEEVRVLAGELLARPRSLVVVGPDDGDLAAELLAAIAP